MAQGGELMVSDGNIDTSGSEFMFDFYCELCREDGLNIEAEGFCVDCIDYLCKTCFHAHRRSRLTRHHDLLDKDSMPKDTPLPQDRINKDISTKCNVHRSKIVEFYCTSHDSLGCSTCFATVHKQCPHIESVYEKAENILASQEYTDYSRNLTTMEQKSLDMIPKIRDNKTTQELMCSEAINGIKKLREEYCTIFDDLEENLMAQVETMMSEDKEKMERLEDEVRAFAKATKHLRSEVENLVTSNRACQVYIQLKERKDEILSIEGNLKNADKGNFIQKIRFEPNNDIKNALKATGFGKIVITNCQYKEETDTTVTEDNRNIRDMAATDVDDLYKNTMDILNALLPQTFKACVSKMRALPIDSETKLKEVVDLVFAKAISEPNRSEVYANLARCLSMVKVPVRNKPEEMMNFRAVLLTRCQRKFEAMLEKREELEDTEPLENIQTKRRFLGNVKFLGELFNMKMLTENIMHDCVLKLFKFRDTEKLECLCVLLTTIGKLLDTANAKPKMDQYFSEMQKIVNGRQMPPKVCLMLQEVINLRLNKWEPRVVDSISRTTDQVDIGVETNHEKDLLIQQAKVAKTQPYVGRKGQMGVGRGGNDDFYTTGGLRSTTLFPAELQMEPNTVWFPKPVDDGQSPDTRGGASTLSGSNSGNTIN